MTRKIFGTDGIRGRANVGPMTPQMVLKIAQATGQKFQRGPHRHLVVIGKDTRLSGYMIEPALTAGFISVGMDVVLLGPLPTPAIAMLTSSLRADLGVMISASHNPYNDNGIKLFGPNGNKLSDDLELEIEKNMENFKDEFLVPAERLGRAKRLDDAPGRYIEFAKATFPKHLRLEGMKIVIDCANGSAYKIAPTVLWELGAEIIAIGVSPDGCNINKECGATAPEALSKAVLEHGAHIGIALDGDADRLIVVDEKGNVIDGDQIIALIATWWKKWELLQADGVVVTIMSNLGLEHYLKDKEIEVYRTSVGDRYVSLEMEKRGCNIGGEPSGHIILRNYGTTGDGLIAALQVLAILQHSKKPASVLMQVFTKVPQLHQNIILKDKSVLETAPVKKALKKIEDYITAKGGRIVVRPSGTEPLVRLMVESIHDTVRTQVMEDLLELLAH
ncbi:MAG: phosphoglucosamine mutase [Alphaproteobacteria bacterium]